MISGLLPVDVLTGMTDVRHDQSGNTGEYTAWVTRVRQGTPTKARRGLRTDLTGSVQYSEYRRLFVMI